MPRIAAFPKCFIEDIVAGRMALETWIDLSAELHVEGLEMYTGFLAGRDASYLAEIRKRAESHGMVIPMFCASPDFTIPDPARRDEEIERYREVLAAAAALGCTSCRVLSGQARPDVDEADGLDWVVSAIRAVLPDAERLGLTLVLENHYKDGFWEFPEFAQSSERFLKILERIDDPRLAVNYDPSNAVVAGEDPIALLDAVLPRVHSMHASDRYLKPGVSWDDLRERRLGYASGLVHGVIGEGINDYDAILSRLAGAGFDGWISLEDGMNGLPDMKKSVDFLREKIAEHFG